MVFVRRVSTSRARRIDKEEALCRYASRFLATWKRFFVFPLSHRPGCRPVVSGAKRRLLVSPRRFSGGVSRGPKHSSARSQETTQPSAHHEDHLRILLRLPRHARGVRPRGHRAVRHLRHAQVRARRVTFLSASVSRGRRRIITSATSPLTPASPAALRLLSLRATARKASASRSSHRPKTESCATSASLPPRCRCATRTARFCAARATRPSTAPTSTSPRTAGSCSPTSSWSSRRSGRRRSARRRR